MQQYEMAVDISDYTAGVPAIKPRVDEVREMFERAGIPTYFLSSAQWVDFGFESVDHHYSCSQLQAFFNYCHTRCRGYAGGKIRYCINAYFAERTLNKGYLLCLPIVCRPIVYNKNLNIGISLR